MSQKMTFGCRGDFGDARGWLGLAGRVEDLTVKRSFRLLVALLLLYHLAIHLARCCVSAAIPLTVKLSLRPRRNRCHN